MSPVALKVLSVGDVCGAEAGCCEQHPSGWTGCSHFGMMWFLSVSLLLNSDQSEVCVCGRVA